MKSVILLVLNNFLNDSRVLKEGISLKNRGYRVRVIALHEDNLNEFEVVDSIEVHRVKLLSRNWSKSKIIQILKYFEFLYRVVKEYRGSDIIHCNDLNALPIGVVIKLLDRDTKIVYDAHEYETQTNGLNGVKQKLVSLLEKSLIGYVDRVITVGDIIASEYVRLYGIDKPALVLNTPPYRDIDKKERFRERFGISKSQTIFLYQGGLSRGRGVEILLEVFKGLDESSVVVFMGYGLLEEMIVKASIEHNNIFFHPAVPPNIVLEYTSSANFGLSIIEDICLSYRYSLPNKMFEYMMVKIPLIVSNLPQMREVVEDYGVGVVVKSNSVEGIRESIREALELDRDELEENLNRAREVFNWQNQERVLVELYSSLGDSSD